MNAASTPYGLVRVVPEWLIPVFISAPETATTKADRNNVADGAAVTNGVFRARAAPQPETCDQAAFSSLRDER
jgi:hypothetical protein